MNLKAIYMNAIVRKPILILFASLLFPAAILAQQIDKEVLVVKPYEPTLSDAVKMNSLPSIIDTFSVKPSFSYGISSVRMPTEFAVNPIPAAKMVPEPMAKLQKSYLKAGIGNYLTPLFELNVNSLRSSKYAAGIFLHHLSSQGKVQLDNGQKVFAGYADNDATLYGKKFMKKAVLQTQGDFQYNKFHYYGYNTSRFNTDTSLNKDDISQNLLRVGGQLELASVHTDSSRLMYDTRLGYHYTSLRNNYAEHAVSMAGTFSKMYAGSLYGVTGGFDYYKPTEILDTSYSTLLRLDPWVSRKSSDWRFMLGLNMYADIKGGKTVYRAYPNGTLEFTAIEKILVPYFGIMSYLEDNNYYKILSENPFISPSLRVRNTDHRVNAYGGMKGNIGTTFAYNLRFTYASIRDMYFFVNDTSDKLNNTFNVVYDNVERLTYTGEVVYTPNNKLEIGAKANYNQYTMSLLEKPWHKELFNLVLSGRYNLQDKILVDMEAFIIGSRFAPNPDPVTAEVRKLMPVVDVNAGVEYRYTKLLSVFLRMNNMGGTRYYRWNQYPMQRFNLMAGFTYAL